MGEEEKRRGAICEELSNLLRSVKERKSGLVKLKNEGLILKEDFSEIYENLEKIHKRLSEAMKRYKCFKQ